MKQKHYLLLKAWLYVVSAVFFISLPLWAKIDNNGPGLPFLVIMIALFSYLAFTHFKKINNTRDQEMAYAPPTDATIEQQIKFYKTYLMIGIVGFIILALITIPDLNNLEFNHSESISLRAPVAFLYNHFGYWTAISFFPIATIIITVLFLRKIYSLKQKP
jgi:hypothetical protein